MSVFKILISTIQFSGTESFEVQPGLYSKHVPIVPVLVESWSGQVNSGPW